MESEENAYVESERLKTRRIILIDEEMDKLLGALCDIALKAKGMEIFDSVKKMIGAVVEEEV